jgi:hypothetical protein
MSKQNYSNHMRLAPGFHYTVYPLLGIALTGGVWFLMRSLKFDDDYAIGFAVSFILLVIGCIFIAFNARRFALKAQDRAIRAEENLRHFALAGKLLDSRITMSQVIALRFASDNEFVALAQRAANENLSSAAIKQSIVNWRADNYRV